MNILDKKIKLHGLLDDRKVSGSGQTDAQLNPRRRRFSFAVFMTILLLYGGLFIYFGCG